MLSYFLIFDVILSLGETGLHKLKTYKTLFMDFHGSQTVMKQCDVFPSFSESLPGLQ